MTRSKAFIKKPLLILLLLIIITVLAIPFVTTSNKVPAELIAVLRPNPITLQQFSLTDQNNKTFNLEQLQGKNSLLFFGYLSCPDICPTTLATMNQIVKKLASQSATISVPQIIFISVDPARDNSEKIAEYIAYFNKSFIGLTGTKDEIDNFTKQFAAGYMIDKSSSSENYLVNHTSSIFMVNPQLKLIASFSPPHHADTLISQYQMISNKY